MPFLSTIAYPFKKVVSLYLGIFALDKLEESHPDGSNNSTKPASSTPIIAMT